MIAEAEVTDVTNVVNTEPKETEPRMDIVIDVPIYELKVKMKLKKLQILRFVTMAKPMGNLYTNQTRMLRMLTTPV